MGTYKEASERMNRTGNGMTDPLKFSSFQEYIVRDVCRYYFELDPIFKDRPNMTPWATNEDDSSDSSVIESEDETITSNDKEDNNTGLVTIEDSDIEIMDSEDSIQLKGRISGQSKNKNKYSTNEDEYDDDSISSNATFSTNHNSSNLSTLSESTILESPKKIKKKKGRRTSKKDKKRTKLTPLEAKTIQKKHVHTNRKTIRKTSSRNSAASLTQTETEDRERLLETRKNKMLFEKERHTDLKKLETEKLLIQRERLAMERDTMKLKHQHMETQNSLERSKIALLRLEMFKERQEIKKNNPEVTDDYLNSQFPYPE